MAKKNDKTKEFFQTGGAKKEWLGRNRIQNYYHKVKIVYLFQNSKLIIIINIINNRKKQKKIQSVSAFCVCKILHFAFKMKLK